MGTRFSISKSPPGNLWEFSPVKSEEKKASLLSPYVEIHPWNDGNGRSARLLEKWFLAQKLGDKAWFIQSEKNYYQNHQTYYKNIRLLGLEYLELDYLQSLPFLLMLPNSLNNIH